MLKTPLKVVPWISYSVIMDAKGKGVATIHGQHDGEHQGVAQELVQTRNSHNVLLEACNAAHEYLTELAADTDISEPYKGISAELALLLVKLEQAIAKAEGETEAES